MLNPNPTESTRAESGDLESVKLESNRSLEDSPRIIEARLPARNGFSKAPNAPSKRPKVKSLWPKRVLLLGILGLVAFAAYSWIVPKHTEAHLTTAVKRGTFDVVVVETGELQSQRSLAITAPVMASGGRSQLAIQYLAPEGTTIDSGTLVVSFDPADQLKLISDKQNELKLSMADLEKMKVQQKADASEARMALENAELSFKLAKLASDAMKFESQAKQRESQLELRKAELAFQQAKQNVKSKSSIGKSEIGNLQLKIGQLQAALDRAQSDMGRIIVKAPGRGLIVYQRSWSTGKKLAKGDQVWGGQPIVQLPDLSHMQAVLQVNEVDVSKVKNAQSVEVALDAFPDKKFTGKVLSVASIGNPKENNPSVKVFEVIVDLDGADSVLKPGMTVAARISVSKIDNVLSVPIESVFEKDGKTIVYVENGTSFDKREVQLGAKNDNFIIVTKGVKEGEKVALVDPNKEQDPKQPTKDAKSKV
ncbi:MAG: efflux RND transporter periplasmic adaptor subunit [Candidatus Kapaibacterium sp.]|jgi:HlyD family secretion protein